MLLVLVVLSGALYSSTIVQASSLASEPAAAPCTLCLLDPSGPSLQASGDSQVLVRWGTVVVDSSSPSAVELSGNANLESAESEVVGGLQRSGHALATPAFAQVPSPGDGDPLATLAEPSPAATATAFPASGTTSAAASPGTYTTFQVSGTAQVTLQPGV